MSQTDTVLLIEDDAEVSRLLLAVLRPHFSEVHCADRLALGLYQLLQRPWSAILLDLNLPDGVPHDLLLKRVRELAPTSAILIITGGTVLSAEDVLKLGAQDFLLKGEFSLTGLPERVNLAILRRQGNASFDPLKQAVKEVGATVGNMQRELRDLQKSVDPKGTQRCRLDEPLPVPPAPPTQKD